MVTRRARSSAADAAILEFVGPNAGKKRKRRDVTPAHAAKLIAVVAARAEEEGAALKLSTPAELVALYGYLHAAVYGVAPAELHGKQWVGAVASARRMVARDFSGDYAAAVAFMRWAWREEREREQWRRETGKGGRRIGWGLQFAHGALLTNYRVDKHRGLG